MLLASQFSAKSKKLFVFTSPFTKIAERGSTRRGIRALPKINVHRFSEPYVGITLLNYTDTETLAYWMSLMHPVIPIVTVYVIDQ